MVPKPTYEELENSVNELAREERYRFLPDNANDFIFKMSIPEGIYEHASPSALKVIGYGPEDLYNNPILSWPY